MNTSYNLKIGYHVMKKTLLFKLSVTIVVLLSAAIFTSICSLQHSALAVLLGERSVPGLGAPIATSGNNIYTAWPNNDTGHWGVFFTKSIDGGLRTS